MKKPPYLEYCPRCDKETKWKVGKPYQRGFTDMTCKECGLSISGYDDFWYDPTEEERKELKLKYAPNS